MHAPPPASVPAKLKRGKVFGIGFGKTGTTSLAAAMKQLGFRVKHSPRSLEQIAECEFANDIAVAWRFRLLDHAFPKAKFILTIRDVEPWLASCGDYVSRVRGGSPLRRLENRFMCFGRTDFEAGDFAAAYQRHVAAVNAHFHGRPEKLLVMNVCAGEGWEALCPFLGIPPQTGPFPHSNRNRAGR
jgi:hypothetical protein